MWSSRSDFNQDLIQSYRSSKLDVGAPTKPIGATLVRAKQRERKGKPPKEVVAALSIFDNLLLDASLWTHCLSVRVYQSRSFDKRRDFKRAMAALFMKVSQDAMVVRNLVATGYDVQARNLLRSIDEHVDALYYLCLRPDACGEFVQTNDSESANRFWWKHIRKARSAIETELKQRFKDDRYLEFTAYKDEERKMFSSVHHPSYVASTVPFLVPYEGWSVFDYLFGIPTEFSYRTCRFLFFILAELALMIGYLDADIDRMIAGRSKSPLQEYIRKGRKHLLRMLVKLTENKEAPVFAQSEVMGRYLEGLPEQY